MPLMYIFLYTGARQSKSLGRYRMSEHPQAFWSLSVAEMLQQLQTAKKGLTSHEAGQRLEHYVCGDSIDSCRNADFALHSTWHHFWVWPTADIISSARRNNCDGLHRFGRDCESAISQKGKELN